MTSLKVCLLFLVLRFWFLRAARAALKSDWLPRTRALQVNIDFQSDHLQPMAYLAVERIRTASLSALHRAHIE
jgi:hypothetical protein